MRRSGSMVMVGLLVLAACCSTDTPSAGDAPAAADQTIPVATPAPSDVSTTPTPSTAAPIVTPADDGTATTAAPVATQAPTPTDESAPTTEATPEATPRPDDGCSADNSPTEPDVADGPVPALEVRAASAANLLPDLAVRRINCAGGWVNLKNEIPADTPLLIWFWAPH